MGIGAALQQFLDTIIVTHLVDSTAIAIGNYAGPLIMLTAFSVKLIGSGGSGQFAAAIGKMDRERAEKIFSTDMLFSAALSLMMMATGFAFIKNLGPILGCSEELMDDFEAYLVPTLLLIPITVMIMTFASFLPAMGYPRLTSWIILTANITNVLLDFVYIKYLGMGIAGAQWATISGYVISLVLILVVAVKDRSRFPAIRVFDSGILKATLFKGLAPGLTQLGIIIYFVYFNRLVTSLGGTTAMKAFSLCLQLMALFTILVQGASDNVRNFVNVLRSQEDEPGIRLVIRYSIAILEVGGLILLLSIQLWPDWFVSLYNFERGSELATHALRIYSFILLFKGIVIIARDYFNAAGHPFVAMALTTAESAVGVGLIAMVLSDRMGLDGVWIAFPITSGICCSVVGILLIIRAILHRRPSYQKAVRMYLTLPTTEETAALPSEEDIADHFSGVVQDGKNLMKAALLVEEMYIYSLNHTTGLRFIDVTIIVKGERTLLLFRSLGDPFDPLMATSEDAMENHLILNQLPSDIQYDYIMGMNTTKIVLE